MENILTQKLNSKNAIIAIVGLGYVGLPLALRFSSEGYKTLGLDIDEFKINSLKKHKTYIEHISCDSLSGVIDNTFFPTSDFSEISKADAIILCVPTPLNKFKEPDLSYVLDTMSAILPHIRRNQILSLESTTYPGTTEEVLLPRITSKGFTIGVDYFLVFSPEREDPGNPRFNTQTIPKICGGITETCQQNGIALYKQVIDTVIPVSSAKVAELTKLLENIHRSVNIGLVNEMKLIADKMNIDIYEVIDAASTKPFGFVPYYPGPGIGGHCIPIDPFYLTWKAKEFGIHTRFIELAGEINSSMPDYVISKLHFGLNQNRKSINGSKVLIMGIAYKKNIDDVRESPSVFIMEKLRDMGALIQYSDPHIHKFPKMREHNFDLESIKVNRESISSFDAVIIATDHDRFDYELIKKHSKLIIDARGKYRESAINVIRA